MAQGKQDKNRSKEEIEYLAAEAVADVIKTLSDVPGHHQFAVLAAAAAFYSIGIEETT